MNTLTLPAKILRAALKATGITQKKRDFSPPTEYIVAEVNGSGELVFSKFNFETHVTYIPDPVADGLVLPSKPFLLHRASLDRAMRATIGMRANPDVTLTEHPATSRLVRGEVRKMDPFVTFEASGYSVTLPHALKPEEVLEAVGDFTEALDGHSYKVTAPELRRSIAAAQACVGKDDTLPVLCGVKIFAEPDGIKMLATDRYKLSRSVLKSARLAGAPNSVTHPTEATVRAVTLANALSILAGQVTVTLGDGMFELADANTRIQTMLTDGDYPRIDSLFPEGRGQIVVVAPRTDLLKTATVVEALAERNTPVLLKGRAGTLGPHFSAESNYYGGGGESRTPDIKAVSHEGNDFDIAFGPWNVKSIFAAIEGEDVTMHINDPKKVVLFVGDPVENFSAEFLAMPVRMPVLDAS